MAKLSDIRDANGTSLQSYAETLQEKCLAAGVETVLIFLQHPNEMNLITSIDVNALPGALSQLASAMRKQASGQGIIATRAVVEKENN